MHLELLHSSLDLNSWVTYITVLLFAVRQVAFRVGPRASVDELSHLLEGYGMPIKGGPTRGDLRVFVQVR